MKRFLHSGLVLAAGVAAGLGTLSSAASEPTPAPKMSGMADQIATELRAGAEEGFIYGLPIVMNYAVMYEYWIDKDSGQYKAPMNTIYNEARVFTPADTAVVTPNSDTPYSFGCFDLRAQPWVLTVPPIEKDRYYAVQFTDWNTFNVGYVGSRTTGNGGGDVLLVGPEWQGQTPPGIKKVIRSTTQFCMAIYRTQLFNGEDMPNVKKIQAGYTAKPLNEYLNQPAPPAAPALNFPKINKEMAKTNFFEYVDFCLQFAPAGPEEVATRAKLAKMGIGPGRTVDPSKITPAIRMEIAEGMKAGEKRVEEKVANFGKEINGWRIGSPFGDRAFYNGDWLLRAAAAQAGIYGNNADEAMYPMTKTLATGEALDGSKNNYTLTFAAGELPPVNAFWSVTMYDGKTQLLVANPINRYLINSPMLPRMKKNADGSLTLYIQKAAPGGEKDANWLPAPDGPIYLVMRLYWPKEKPPSILPPGAGTWQPPGVMVAR